MNVARGPPKQSFTIDNLSLFLYHTVSFFADCVLQMSTYLDAMFFSIETMFTIGYGAAGNNIFFSNNGQGCPEMFVVIFINCYVGLSLSTLIRWSRKVLERFS